MTFMQIAILCCYCVICLPLAIALRSANAHHSLGASSAEDGPTPVSFPLDATKAYRLASSMTSLLVSSRAHLPAGISSEILDNESTNVTSVLTTGTVLTTTIFSSFVSIAASASKPMFSSPGAAAIVFTEIREGESVTYTYESPDQLSTWMSKLETVHFQPGRKWTTMKFTVEAKPKRSVTGKDMFQAFMGEHSREIDCIYAQWSAGFGEDGSKTNVATFLEHRDRYLREHGDANKELWEKESAKRTWTGKMAKAYGFKTVHIGDQIEALKQYVFYFTRKKVEIPKEVLEKWAQASTMAHFKPVPVRERRSRRAPADDGADGSDGGTAAR